VPPVDFETVRRLALALPGVEEGVSYGTPALRVRAKFLARLREDGETLALRIGFDERELLLAADPEVFFLTDHYRGYPSVLVRLARASEDVLREVLEQAWRKAAPKRLVAAHDAAHPPTSGKPPSP
jgi:hypothetical protein